MVGLLTHLAVAHFKQDVDVIAVFEEPMKAHNAGVAEGAVDLDLGSELQEAAHAAGGRTCELGARGESGAIE